MFLDYKKYIIAFFMLLVPVCLYELYHLKFSFDFEQFFPQGDPDLEFFREFTADFETDDNFLLLAVQNEPSVFDSSFLKSFHQFTLDIREVPHVTRVQSLTTIDYPVKTPFGVSSIPAIHIDEPDRYDSDRKRIMEDVRFVDNLINKDATAMVITIRTIDAINLEQSGAFISGLQDLIKNYDFQETHMLGRAFFQDELVRMQKREVVISTIISGLLVTLILMFIFRKPIGVFIALNSIGLGLLIFMGMMGILGREMNIMSALYPVLMLIVGTSDVIHIMTKYVDELHLGKDRRTAMVITIKEIGLATLLTSLTTAIGFATLLTSNVAPIRQFGANAAMGVLIAYFTVIFLTTSTLVMFRKDQIMAEGKSGEFWNRLMKKWYQYGLKNPKTIWVTSVILLFVFIAGMTQVTTNYKIASNLPIKAKITEDFRYFEELFSGYRPIEYAITVKPDSVRADSYEVLNEVSKIEDQLRENENIKFVTSLTTIYKSIERMNKGNTVDAYQFPDNKRDFVKAKRIVDRVADGESAILISKDKKKTRISTRTADIGADRIEEQGIAINQWIDNNVDTSLIEVRQTGTGLLVDKNGDYIVSNLMSGLAIAIALVSILMALLFMNFRMLLIALIPNIFPVLFAASLLGYLNIELEAGVSVIFAVIFGIAVDDTIHFLSKYKLCRYRGRSVEEAIRITFEETGKAITFTTIILFFGFLVMLFSNHPPSVTVGVLISVTLIGALICDLFLLPVVMRKVLK